VNSVQRLTTGVIHQHLVLIAVRMDANATTRWTIGEFLRLRNREPVLPFTDMATEKEKRLVRLIIQSALDRAEKAQRWARRHIQAAIGRALQTEFGSERQVPAHILKLLNQGEQKPDNKQK
jgi:hypothetical protein